ncbi:hypothetical protein Q3G72_033633 [Acer saccharum]|nr:hypothetical protein Q3G72_033633 [Acer saccharum]
MPDSFIRLIGTRCLFTFAVQMQAVIVAWQVYALTHDPLMLGLVGLAEAAPALSLALYGGMIVDRGNPLFVYRCVLALSFVSAAALIVSHLPGLELALTAQLTTLYLASVMTGIARAFSQPAMFSLVPRLVARENLTRAAAWMSSSMQLARVAGPAVGGLVYGYFGMLAAIVAVCVLLALGIGLVRRCGSWHIRPA